MPESVFSSARLRAYRPLEDAGLWTAADMAIRNTLIGSHLWLPVSLIEIAFRNLADAAICAIHPAGPGWLIATGQNEDGSIDPNRLAGPAWLHMERDDGSIEDPVRIAGGMAQRHSGRGVIGRDDLIANLMLGFWVNRVPEGLEAGADGHPPLDVFAAVAQRLGPPVDTGCALRDCMVDDILRIRNRLAHHEPLLFRRKHLLHKKTQKPKSDADLVTSLQGAIESFRREAEEVVEIARAMAPLASDHLDLVSEQIASDLDPLAARLAEERAKLREAREARRASRLASDAEPPVH